MDFAAASLRIRYRRKFVFGAAMVSLPFDSGALTRMGDSRAHFQPHRTCAANPDSGTYLERSDKT